MPTQLIKNPESTVDRDTGDGGRLPGLVPVRFRVLQCAASIRVMLNGDTVKLD